MLKILGYLSLLLSFMVFCNGEKFTVTSDAPAILGSNVTFTAILENTIYATTYTIVFQENYPNRRSYQTSVTKSSNYTATWTAKYDKAPGIYAITVTAAYKFIFDIPVATVLHSYEITQNFTGHLEISQPGVPRKQQWSVSTLNETEVSLLVHDPSNYLKTATKIDYVWIQNGTILANSSTPTVRMNFTKEFTYPIRVNLTATFNNNGTDVLKYGSFAQNVYAKVPIVNFTVNGATWFRHGKLLDLTLTCDGTPPYGFCWMLREGPYNRTGNETCEPMITTDCSIHVSRYFIESGTYSLLVLLDNDVGKIFNQTGIHVYKTTRKPQLSIIIVPISFTLIAIVLIIFGVAYYWENHIRYNVEVADFDFSHTEDTPYVRFLDRLRDAVSSSVRLRGHRDSLLIPPDNEASVRYGSTLLYPN